MAARAALIVACDVYEDPELSRLRVPVQDAQALSDVLSDPGVGGFQVRTLLNEPAFLVNEEIERFFADRRRDDLLLLYFSCHAVRDQSGRLYFAATNTKLTRLGATGISSAFVGEQMERSASRRVVLLLDCCYSGAFARGLLPRGGGEGIDLQERFGGRGRAVITASNAMEYAFEGDELSMQAGQPSVFTSAVVQGLRTGQADRDGDGWVSVDDLYEYVFEQVREATPHQTPSMFANLQGELFLAHNPNPVAPPTALPAELLQAASSVIAWQREGAVAGLEALLASDQPRLAGAARGALQRLAADDDSRRVSAAAHAALARSGEPAAIAPAASERRAAPPVSAPRDDHGSKAPDDSPRRIPVRSARRPWPKLPRFRLPRLRRTPRQRGQGRDRGAERVERSAQKRLSFTVAYPDAVASTVWDFLWVFLHPARLQAAADDLVAQRSRQLGFQPATSRASAFEQVQRGTMLRLIPQVRGLYFDPPSQEVAWFEGIEEVEFRLWAAAKTTGRVLLGAVEIYAGALPVGRVPLAIRVRGAAENDPDAGPTVATAQLFRSVFVSYSHEDSVIVQACAEVYTALGIDVLTDKTALRSGQPWRAALQTLVEKADLFQLYWSAASSKSPHVTDEWQHALSLQDRKGEQFIRPLRWEDPWPDPPGELAHIHSAPLDLTALSKVARDPRG